MNYPTTLGCFVMAFCRGNANLPNFSKVLEHGGLSVARMRQQPRVDYFLSRRELSRITDIATKACEGYESCTPESMAWWDIIHLVLIPDIAAYLIHRRSGLSMSVARKKLRTTPPTDEDRESIRLLLELYQSGGLE